MKYETVLLFQSSQTNLIINEKVTLHQVTMRTTKYWVLLTCSFPIGKMIQQQKLEDDTIALRPTYQKQNG